MREVTAYSESPIISARSITDSVPVAVIADAANGFAQVALEASRSLLLDKVGRTGIAALAIRNFHHFSALWPEIRPGAWRRSLSPMAAPVWPHGVLESRCLVQTRLLSHVPGCAPMDGLGPSVEREFAG